MGIAGLSFVYRHMPQDEHTHVYIYVYIHTHTPRWNKAASVLATRLAVSALLIIGGLHSALRTMRALPAHSKLVRR